MPLPRSLARAALAALDLVAPPRCLSCGANDRSQRALCAACDARLVSVGVDPCPVCAGPLGPGAGPGACPTCPVVRPRFVAACAAVRYAGLGGELVRRAKYGRDTLFAMPLVRRLVASVESWPAAPRVDVVVSVPTTRMRRRERGFNLADVFAEPLARALGRPFRPYALSRVGEPPPQASLTRTERRRAAAGTVRVRLPHPSLRRILRGRGVAGANVLLVDDVLTTGATANACTQALLDAGARTVILAVATRA